MPEVILKFKVPEEDSELTLAQKGSDFYCAIHSFDQDYLRHKIKYEELTQEQAKVFIEVRDVLHEYLKDHGIDLYSLVE